MREGWRGVALAAVAAAIAVAPAAAAPVATFDASRRDGCVAPCAVLFDATASRDAGVARAFSDLDFRWDFGDEHGELWSISGRPKNRAIGGIAGHLYTRPGRYAVTLTVANPAGQRATAHATVVVADPDASFTGERTTCVSVRGDFAGCPAGARHVTSGDFDASLANADGHRTLFRRGESFHWNQIVRLADAGERGAAIDVFGEGDGRATAVAAGPVTLEPGNDWRVAHLVLRGPGTNAPVTAIHEPNGVTRFTADDLQIVGFNACANFWSPARPDSEVAFVDVRCAEFPDPGTGTKFYEDTQRSMFLGLDLDKGDHVAAGDQTEFAYRTVFSDRKLIEHSRFRGRAPNMSKNLLQLRHCPTEGPWTSRCADGKVPSRYVIVSDDHFIEGGGPRAITVIRVCDHGSCTGAPGASQPLEDYVFERNLVQVDVRDAAKESMESVFMLQGAHLTVRDNVADLQGWPRGAPQRMVFALYAPPSNPSRDRAEDVVVRGNAIYLGAGYSGSAILCGAPRGGADLHCDDNVLYAPQLAGTRAATLGSGWTSRGNRLDGANPFASGPPPPLTATLRDLEGFRLRSAAP